MDISRVDFIEHDGRKVLQIDLSGARLSDILGAIRDGKRIIASQPPGSLLTLTDVTDADTGQDVSKALKEFTTHNKPYVKAGAVLGVTGVKRVTFNAVLVVSGRRNLHLFERRQEALDWLITQ